MASTSPPPISLAKSMPAPTDSVKLDSPRALKVLASDSGPSRGDDSIGPPPPLSSSPSPQMPYANGTRVYFWDETGDVKRGTVAGGFTHTIRGQDHLIANVLVDGVGPRNLPVSGLYHE